MIALKEFSPSPQKLVLTLNLGTAGDVTVRACEVLGKGVRNRISFFAATPMFDVFQESFAQKLNKCLRSIDQETGVIALPDFRLHIRGFVVAGLHMLISRISATCRQVICRFQHFLGGLDAALKSGFSSTPSLASYQDKIATDTIAEISLPLLNLCELNTLSKDGDVDLMATKAYLERLNEKRHELEFYTELLKRFVEGSVQSEDARTDELCIENDPPQDTWTLLHSADAHV